MRHDETLLDRFGAMHGYVWSRAANCKCMCEMHVRRPPPGMRHAVCGVDTGQAITDIVTQSEAVALITHAVRADKRPILVEAEPCTSASSTPRATRFKACERFLSTGRANTGMCGEKRPCIDICRAGSTPQTRNAYPYPILVRLPTAVCCCMRLLSASVSLETRVIFRSQRISLRRRPRSAVSTFGRLSCMHSPNKDLLRQSGCA